MSSYEFFCEVQDRNIIVNGSTNRGFLATVQFMSNQVLIMCMDASQKGLDSSEVYFKVRPNEQRCPTFHQISYSAIRYIKRQGRTVTLCGLRKDVQLRLSPINDTPVDEVLDQIEVEGRRVFTPVDVDDIKRFIGESDYRRFTESHSSIQKQSADLRFWINNLYQTLCSPEINPSQRNFESWLLVSKQHQQTMERIVRVFRTQIVC